MKRIIRNLLIKKENIMWKGREEKNKKFADKKEKT